MKWRFSVVISPSLQNIMLVVSFWYWPKLCILWIHPFRQGPFGSKCRVHLADRHLYNTDTSRSAIKLPLWPRYMVWCKGSLQRDAAHARGNPCHGQTHTTSCAEQLPAGFRACLHVLLICRPLRRRQLDVLPWKQYSVPSLSRHVVWI